MNRRNPELDCLDDQRLINLRHNIAAEISEREGTPYDILNRGRKRYLRAITHEMTRRNLTRA